MSLNEKEQENKYYIFLYFLTMTLSDAECVNVIQSAFRLVEILIKEKSLFFMLKLLIINQCPLNAQVTHRHSTDFVTGNIAFVISVHIMIGGFYK